MRLPAALVATFVALLVPAGARGEGETDVSKRTLGGHTFMYPATIDSAFPATYFGTRTAARSQTTSNLPLGTRTTDIDALGVREQVDFELALGDQFSAGIGLLGQAIFGTSGRALASQGALYEYGALLNGAFRVARIESSGTQIAVRAQFFGVQGGGRISLVGLVRAVRDQPLRSVPDILSNFGDLVVTPESWYGGAASVNVAQAITPTFSLQASFRLDLRHFKQSPFILGQGRVDVTTTDWIPQVGVAFGVNPPDWPLAFSAEYRFASQQSGDPASPAHHVVGVAGYYSARRDLQLGPAVFGEFGLPEIQGVDDNGNPAGSDRGKAITGQLMMRYFW